MRYTKIATAKPFAGAPKINIASVFGASPNKPFILRIPVTGERPIKYGAENLPTGLKLEDNIITGAVLTIPGVIFSESNLSYLGIINLQTSSLTSVGTMLSQGQGYLQTFPHIIFFPAIFISLLMISFNLFGNGLRDAFNPSLRGVEE